MKRFIKKTPVPDQHHVVRFCKRRLTIRKDDKVIGLFSDALFLRKDVKGTGPERYLSCVYYEYFDGNGCLRMLSCEDATRVIGKKADDAMFRLSVEGIRKEGASRRRRITIWHKPDDTENPAYGGMDGFPLEPDLELVQNILEYALVELATIEEIKAGIISG